MLVSKVVKSFADEQCDCSSQCFCMMRPSSIDNSAESSKSKAATTMSPESDKMRAMEDAITLKLKCMNK